jgi:hypothetical protein
VFWRFYVFMFCCFLVCCFLVQEALMVALKGRGGGVPMGDLLDLLEMAKKLSQRSVGTLLARYEPCILLGSDPIKQSSHRDPNENIVALVAFLTCC